MAASRLRAPIFTHTTSARMPPLAVSNRRYEQCIGKSQTRQNACPEKDDKGRDVTRSHEDNSVQPEGAQRPNH